MHKKTLGVVLAGGRSSRMGEDKALLCIEAQSMIDRTSALLAKTSVEKVVVSRNDDKHKHFSDIIPDKGPLSGIHSIATRFPHYNLMVVPVDLPLLTSECLQTLIHCGQEEAKNTCFANDNLPLFIVNSASFRQVLDYTLRLTNNFSVGGLCSHFSLAKLNNPIRSTMFNANTPQQWRFALQHFDNTPSSNPCGDVHEPFK